MMKLKILNERPLTQARLSPTRQSRLFEEAISNCNAKKAGFGRKTTRLLYERTTNVAFREFANISSIEEKKEREMGGMEKNFTFELFG